MKILWADILNVAKRSCLSVLNPLEFSIKHFKVELVAAIDEHQTDRAFGRLEIVNSFSLNVMKTYTLWIMRFDKMVCVCDGVGVHISDKHFAFEMFALDCWSSF